VEILTLTLTGMAHGGAAMGRDENNRPVFVPFGIAGETVRVRIVDDRKRYAHARLLEVIEPAPERAEPRCAHFGPCGGCHYQHINYESQLYHKTAIVEDQLARIGGLKHVKVRPTLGNGEPWYYGVEAHLSPAPEGGLGYWSPAMGQVMAIRECHIIRPQLVELLHDVDLDVPGLRRLTLRVGDDEALLAGLETEDMEPPELEADFPLSVALLLPDGTAANLIGDNYVVQSVNGHDFRISPGAFFYPNLPATAQLIESVLAYARLTGTEDVLECYSGVGTLTAFLGPAAGTVTGIEANPDAVVDAAVNLAESDNVSLYEGPVEEILPHLSLQPDLVVVDPPGSGLSQAALASISSLKAPRLVYVSSDVATLARDGRQLVEAGYRPVEVQPIDMYPQTYQIQTVSLWKLTVNS
jgi:23S rRNA (uracil1939-C5)-methyltransferase